MRKLSQSSRAIWTDLIHVSMGFAAFIAFVGLGIGINEHPLVIGLEAVTYE